MKQSISILLLISSFYLLAQEEIDQPKSFVVDGNTITIESFNWDYQTRHCPGYNVIQNGNRINSLDGGQYGYPAEFEVIESKGNTHLLFDNNYYYPFGLTYRSFVTNPVYLKNYNNRWFIVSLLDKDEMVYLRVFDRNNELIVLDCNIPSDIKFDTEEYFDSIIGVSRPINGKIEEFEIQLIPEGYPYITTKPIHHSQRNDDRDNKVVLRVIRNKELEMLVSSLGGKITML